jgi:NADH pyrophosphatase NudC (nudix superfamily)
VRSRKNVGTMTPDPHMAALVSTVLVGVLMSFAGLQKNALEWRRRRRICPSCGHHLRGRACSCR